MLNLPNFGLLLLLFILITSAALCYKFRESYGNSMYSGGLSITLIGWVFLKFSEFDILIVFIVFFFFLYIFRQSSKIDSQELFANGFGIGVIQLFICEYFVIGSNIVLGLVILLNIFIYFADKFGPRGHYEAKSTDEIKRILISSNPELKDDIE